MCSYFRIIRVTEFSPLLSKEIVIFSLPLSKAILISSTSSCRPATLYKPSADNPERQEELEMYPWDLDAPHLAYRHSGKSSKSSSFDHNFVLQIRQHSGFESKDA